MIWVLVAAQFGICMSFALFLAARSAEEGVLNGSAIHLLVAFFGLVSGTIYVNTFNLLRHSTYFHVDASNGEGGGGATEAKSRNAKPAPPPQGGARELVMGVVVCATTAGPIVAALVGIYLEPVLLKM